MKYIQNVCMRCVYICIKVIGKRHWKTFQFEVARQATYYKLLGNFVCLECGGGHEKEIPLDVIDKRHKSRIRSVAADHKTPPTWSRSASYSLLGFGLFC